LIRIFQAICKFPLLGSTLVQGTQMTHLEDHGLPLVRFKGHRRELVVALAGSTTISPQQIAEIAAMQHSIAAIEAVINDLDAEVADVPTGPTLRLVHTAPVRPVLERTFGRRRA
jgi:hypothetical protein